MKWIYIIAMLLLCLAQGADSADKTKKQKANDAELATTQVRLWKDAFSPDRSIRVVLRFGADKGCVIETEFNEGYEFRSYQVVPSGLATVEISAEKDTKTPPAKRIIFLPPSSFSTILIRESNSLVNVESINDTALSDSADTGEVTVRNLFPEISSLQIKIGDELHAELKSKDLLINVRGLPRKVFRIETSGFAQTGERINWTNEVNLQRFRKVTILVYPDSFGRVRPRLFIDGTAGDAPSDETSSSTPQ